jgi:uncharacterized protein
VSEDSVDVVRSSYEAFGRGDFGAVMETIHPEIEWTDPETLPWGGTHRGHEAFGAHMQDFAGHFDEVAIEPERFLDAGDTVVVLGAFSGRGKGGGEFRVPATYVWELSDGKARRVTAYTDTAAVLAALERSG